MATKVMVPNLVVPVDEAYEAFLARFREYPDAEIREWVLRSAATIEAALGRELALDFLLSAFRTVDGDLAPTGSPKEIMTRLVESLEMLVAGIQNEMVGESK